MKKVKKKEFWIDKRFYLLAQRIETGKIGKIIKKYRKAIGMPEDGFRHPDEVKAFLKKHSSRGQKRLREKKLDEYYLEVRKNLSHLSIPESVDPILKDYLYTSGSSRGFSIDWSGCDFFPVSKRNINEKKSELSAGLYIKIDLNSTCDDLRKFVKTREFKGWFDAFQNKIRHDEGIKKTQRFREMPNWRRDVHIYQASKLPIKELRSVTGFTHPRWSKYRIIKEWANKNPKKFGLGTKKLTSKNVERIIYEQRKLHK